MKTEFSDFCQSLGSLVAPFNVQLREVLGGMQEQKDLDALRPVIAALSEVQHRFQTLEEKVAGQQAYVSIFGPLKSGKSTLMNAISGAYVSEITSLPAYPCLVYVKDGADKKFQLTSYRGERKACANSAEMQKVLAEAHVSLAEQIRQSEERGEQFDPVTHYPEAIRRVDVELPAPALQNSQTILVDTPGLYSRMKFGYELMTREFRDSAACAVFVVKTDNLFLEQVFAEFNDLLGLFSRIFLVVNLDSGKRDIGPDGQLHPSLESRNPEEIIRAFESLSMSAPLRKAADEGRLKIYPIDLLHAALSRMRSENSDTQSADEENRLVEDAAGAFKGFLQDLTDYLNSSDYLLEFMQDSLRQGKNLASEVVEWCQPDKRESFELRQKSLRLLLTQSESSLRDLKTFISSNSTEGFEGVKSALQEAVKDFGQSRKPEIEKRIRREIEDWWGTDESLNELQEQRFQGRIQLAVEELSAQVRQALESLLVSKNGGLNLTPSQIQFLKEVELPIEKVREESLAKSRDFIYSSTRNRLQLNTEEIHVKKGFVDWLLFRNRKAVRKALFGNADTMDKPLPAAKKISRLGDEGKTSIIDQTEQYLNNILGEGLNKYAGELLALYTEHFQSDLKGRLADLETRLQSRIEDCRKRLQANAVIEENLGKLVAISSDLSEKLEGIETVRSEAS